MSWEKSHLGRRGGGRAPVKASPGARGFIGEEMGRGGVGPGPHLRHSSPIVRPSRGTDPEPAALQAGNDPEHRSGAGKVITGPCPGQEHPPLCGFPAPQGWRWTPAPPDPRHWGIPSLEPAGEGFQGNLCTKNPQNPVVGTVLGRCHIPWSSSGTPSAATAVGASKRPGEGAEMKGRQICCCWVLITALGR